MQIWQISTYLPFLYDIFIYNMFKLPKRSASNRKLMNISQQGIVLQELLIIGWRAN